jgi:hypothetical protein
MALPLVTVTYTVPVKGQTPANIAAALAAVPLPLRTLFDLGVYVVSDTPAAGPPATRTIVLRINSPDPPTATAALAPGQDASPILSTTVTHAGSGLIKPPSFLVFDPSGQTLAEWLNGPPDVVSPPGRGAKLASYMEIIGVTTTAHGGGYSSETTVNLIGGFPKGTATDVQLPDPLNPLMQPGAPLVFRGSDGVGTRISDPPTNVANELATFGDVAILDPGIGYNPSTTVIAFLDAEPVGGRVAKAHATFDAMGRITKVILTDPGQYIVTPKVVARDPSRDTKKFGAKLGANMLRGKPATFGISIGEEGALTVTLVDGGDGYTEIPGDGSLVIFDPTGGGSGASATVGPVIGGATSRFGLSRVDLLNRGSAYTDPVLSERSYFENLFLVAENRGGPALLAAVLDCFGNLMKTAIQNVVLTEVSETVA